MLRPVIISLSRLVDLPAGVILCPVFDVRRTLSVRFPELRKARYQITLHSRHISLSMMRQDVCS